MNWKKWIGKNSSDLFDRSIYDEIQRDKLPQHIAIIMDGNGRWAQKRGLPRALGHQAGVEALRNIIKACAEMKIQVLSAYAFSTENWKRPIDEVSLLMDLFSKYIVSELAELDANQVRICFSGEIEALHPSLYEKFLHAQEKTQHNKGLILNMAVNYGGRAEILRAVRLISEKVNSNMMKIEDISIDSFSQHLYTGGLPDPDLLIRPSGDYRISNFLLWQCAYTEFWFTNTHWPDFTVQELMSAIRDFQKRERRFGGLDKKKQV